MSPHEIGSNRKQSSRADCGIRAPRLQPTNSNYTVRFVRPCRGREMKRALRAGINATALRDGDGSVAPTSIIIIRRKTDVRRAEDVFYDSRETIKHIDERIPGSYVVTLASYIAFVALSARAPVSSPPYLRSPGPFPAGLTTGCRITVFHFYVGVRRAELIPAGCRLSKSSRWLSRRLGAPKTGQCRGTTILIETSRVNL